MIASYRIASLAWKSSALCIFTSPSLLTSDHHWSFYSLHNFSFYRMSYHWNHSVCSLFRLAGRIFEGHVRKSWDCSECIVSRNWMLNTAGMGSVRCEEHGRENLYCLREYLIWHKQTMCGNMDVKGTAGESSEGIEKNAIRNWRKDDHCYLVSEAWLNCVLQLCERHSLWARHLKI